MLALQAVLATQTFDHHPHRHLVAVIDLVKIAQVGTSLKPTSTIGDLRLHKLVVVANVRV